MMKSLTSACLFAAAFALQTESGVAAVVAEAAIPAPVIPTTINFPTVFTGTVTPVIITPVVPPPTGVDPNIATLTAALSTKGFSNWGGVQWRWNARTAIGDKDYFAEDCKNSKTTAQKVTFTFGANFDHISPESTNNVFSQVLQPGEFLTNIAVYKTQGGAFSWSSVYSFKTEDYVAPIVVPVVDPNIAVLQAALDTKTFSNWSGVQWRWNARTTIGDVDYFAEECKNSMNTAQKVTFKFGSGYTHISPAGSVDGTFSQVLQPGETLTNVAKYKVKGSAFSWSGVYSFSKVAA